MQAVDRIAGSYSMADNGALSFDKKHHQKPERNLPNKCLSSKWTHFRARGVMERWEMMKKGRMTEADRNHLKCLSPSSYRAASVDSESMFVCVWRIGVLPLSLWSIFLIPRGENEADVLLIRFAFTLFFFVSTFCLMLMSFSWMTLICVISMCLWSHYSFVSLWKYLAVYMHMFSSVKMNYRI